MDPHVYRKITRMKTAPARPGWYNGSIAAIHAALGLIELKPVSGNFTILAPARKFEAVAQRRGAQVKFCVGEFGGVTDVEVSDARSTPVRVARSHAKDRAVAHG